MYNLKRYNEKRKAQRNARQRQALKPCKVTVFEKNTSTIIEILRFDDYDNATAYAKSYENHATLRAYID